MRNPTPKPPAREKTARGAAVASAAGAVACGVCCVLPFALPPVALASIGSDAEFDCSVLADRLAIYAFRLEPDPEVHDRAR